MAKAKPKAAIMVADGAGGMVQVQDRRFEMGDWPIRFEVPKEQADTWLRYLYAECERRRWSSGGIGQLEARENSGSITVNIGGAAKPQLAVVWERKRGGPIKVRARSAGVPEFPLVEAEEFFSQVNDRCRSGVTEPVYRRGQLQFDGLAWRGEFWLDDTVRLGPPTEQYEAALLGPRFVLVDAVVDCVGRGDSAYVFDRLVRELAAFLSVVMGVDVRPPEQGRVWTFTSRPADCAVRDLGYIEQENPKQMPVRGACPPLPLNETNRPDFSNRGIDENSHEQTLPADITELWAKYRSLTPNQREQFLQVAAKWQEALSHWSERPTLSVALMVVACEGLKPSNRQSRRHNVYHVVEALLGAATADRLQEQWFRPQDVRNVHLHRGEFRSSELLHNTMMSSFQDPTFDQARRELAPIAQAAIIEWLKRRGTFTMPTLERKNDWRRWVKKYALTLLPSVTIVTLVLGWLLGVSWRG